MGYKFSMNPYGVQMDEQRFDDDDGTRAGTQSGKVRLKSIVLDGWRSFKIPFFNMRFPDRDEQVGDSICSAKYGIRRSG